MRARTSSRARVLLCCMPTMALLLALQGVPPETGSRIDTTGFRPLEGVYEPSGVVQLADGRLVVAEDEAARPLALLTPDSASEVGFGVEPLRPESLLATALLRIDDLEGLAIAPEDLIYAVTSHSRNARGKRDPAREQLLRFTVKGNRLQALGTQTRLRDALSEAFPELGKAARERDVKNEDGLSIEGLAYDPRDRRLWVGLRGPVIDDMAVLVAIVEPSAAFEPDGKLAFAADPVLLDLDGGGVRGLSYAARLGGFLLLSQEATKKGNKPFKLWLWSGDSAAPPRRVRIAGLDDLKHAESVFPVRFGSREYLLLVSDDGDSARGRAARFAFVDFSRLRIEPPVPSRRGAQSEEAHRRLDRSPRGASE